MTKDIGPGLWSLIATLLPFLILGPSVTRGATFHQVAIPLRGQTVGKLTRSYTRAELDVDLFRSLDAVESHSYRDPGTQDKVNVMVGVDARWNRIVWSTDYQGETTIHDWGVYGSGPDQLDTPSDLAINGSNGMLFIADTGNHRIKVLAWIADSGIPGLARTYSPEFSIPGGTTFRYPNQVQWDDNGTPGDSQDDILWVLDRLAMTIAGFHIVYSSSEPHWSYSPYVTLRLNQLFPATNARRLTAFTKVRGFSAPSPSATYCTETLIVYDAANRCFLRLSIPHSSGQIASPATQVSMSTVPNPIPRLVYTRLTSDAWGNINALDSYEPKLTRFSPSLTVVGTYGTRGVGGLGTGQMLSPRSFAFHTDHPPDANYSLSKQALLGELWSDSTGVQGLEVEQTLSDLATWTPSSSMGQGLSFKMTDHARVRTRILNASNSVVLRTVADSQVMSAGVDSVVWDGLTDGGAVASPCTAYRFEVQAVSLYSPPDTSTQTVSFYYKPRLVKNLYLQSNVPGASVKRDGVSIGLQSNPVAAPCSLCTVHSIYVAPTQTVTGVRYCFNYWSNQSYRSHGVEMRGDSTITLNLTTYSGPTTVPPNGILYDDAYDCKSPYIFQGNATLTTSSPTDTFHTWGSVNFRVTKNVGAKLTVARPLVGKALKFESTDSTIGGSNLWKGIRLTSAGALVLDSCEVRSAEYGVQGETGAQIDSLALDRCTFESNLSGDVFVNFDPDPTRTATARLFRSNFQNASGVTLVVSGTSLAPVATANITECKFTNSGPNGSLSMLGGWNGPIQSNTFTVNHPGYSVKLYRNGTYASPSVSFTGNKFAIAPSPPGKAMLAPGATGNGLHIDARNNDWSFYTTAQIENVIDHGMDAQYPTLTIVDFQPWTPPPGGGGGGGGGGCPFVLTKTDAGYVVENSILGRSEVAGAMVEDACPISAPVKGNRGTVQVRIAELESDTDVIDRIGLGAIEVPDGYDLSTDDSGRPMLVQWPDAPAEELARSSKITAFISPVAPGSAYSGAQGDSLDLLLPYDPGPTPGKRRIGINMIPKPPEASTQPGRTTGVIIRASSDKDGDRWVTIGRLLPREHWSTETIGLGNLDGGVVRRLRLVWQSRHTLGRIGIVSTAEAKVSAVAAVSARHSNGTDVSAVVQRQDWQSVTLRPGEHVDLEYDISRVSATSRLVLLAHGRYFPPGVEPTPDVPVAYFLGQNHPNPFNPLTAIEYGIPASGRVTIRIFDVSGRLVRTLVNQELPAGYHRADWDGRTASGTQVGSGIYFYELRSNVFSQKRRMVLIR